ncbi:MAG TPA: hypothetical protein VH140_00660 [Candidatus Acidoferrum sp.]|nr:hypothetical protein [Candidatus Acidoferrum sp.]
MLRIRTKIGDVFSVPLEGVGNKYFQYIANDLTQLNSDVIRAFVKTYPTNSSPDLPEAVKGDVDFYAHVVIKWGIKMNLWQKVGNVSYSERLDVLFRSSRDSGKRIETSHDWRIWRINEKFQNIGKLEGDYRNAEIGIVVSPPDVVERMKTGKYEFVYPGY